MPKSLAHRFMRTFAKGVWGELTDRTVESFALVGAVLAILIKNHFSFKKSIDWDSVAIGVTAISFLIMWHGFRSAYALSAEISEEQHAYGFSNQQKKIRLPRLRLYGVASSLTVISAIASYALWVKILRAPNLTATSSPPSGTPTPAKPADDPVPSGKGKPKSKPIKNPLRIMALNARQGISLENNSFMSIYVMDLLVTLDDPPLSYSQPINMDMKAGQMQTHNFENTATYKTFVLAPTWHEHYQKGFQVYGVQCVAFPYFSPDDVTFKQITSFHESRGAIQPSAEAKGILHYRLAGETEPRNQSVEVRILAAVDANKCPSAIP